MASGWQEAAAQQAEEVSARLRQLLTTGLGLLRSELGLELGLQPQLYPSWVFLAVPAFLGLLLLLLLLHCASSSSRGKPATRADREPAALLTKAAGPAKPAKPEEAKKKSKKKPQPDKAKPNGRPVELAEEETIPAVKKESPKQTTDADKKNEKVKKAKKKPKADGKQTQSPSQDKKEAEEGNWETKISNKEKRQQRKRDKGADSDVLPEATPSFSESFAPVPSQSTSIRKSKGSSEVPAVNGSGWNEKPTKVIPSQVIEEKWVPSAPPAGKKKNEPWNQDAVDTNAKDWSAPWSERSIFPGIAPWTTAETRITQSEQRAPHFSTIGLNSTVSAAISDPVPQACVSDSQWDAAPNEPSLDDEWSGLNGQSSADLGSDWNAPAEEWGNYGEEEPASAPQVEEPEQEIQKVSEDEKEKEETAAQTAAGSKTKKKKKKKKKQGEESGSPTQEAEGAREALNDYKEYSTPAPPPVVIPPVTGKSNEFKEAVKETKAVKETRTHAVITESSVSEKSSPLVQQPQDSSSAPAKQNSVPPLQSLAKSEESWESAKQVKKKKKARRET